MTQLVPYYVIDIGDPYNDEYRRRVGDPCDYRRRTEKYPLIPTGRWKLIRCAGKQEFTLKIEHEILPAKWWKKAQTTWISEDRIIFITPQYEEIFQCNSLLDENTSK